MTFLRSCYGTSYCSIFQAKQTELDTCLLSIAFPEPRGASRDLLNAQSVAEEVKIAAADVPPAVALGPDGIHAERHTNVGAILPAFLAE